MFVLLSLLILGESIGFRCLKSVFHPPWTSLSFAHLIELNCCCCRRSTEGLSSLGPTAVKLEKTCQSRRVSDAPSSASQDVALAVQKGGFCNNGDNEPLPKY